MTALVRRHFLPDDDWRLANGRRVAAFVTHRPAPLCLNEESRVRVKVSGVNPLDTKIRAGQTVRAQTKPPAVLGLDLAGVVVEVATEGRRVPAGRRGLRTDRLSR
jgi:NADPH:quinone reductase-like Zn-dependent oxidoreductase